METDSKQFTVAEVLEAMERAVAKRGADYMYERPEDDPYVHESQCLYVHYRGTEKETPGCIVGQVYFDLLGVQVPLSEEGHDAFDATECTPLEPVNHVLAAAQREQDNGAPWGEALEAARARAAGFIVH